LIILCSDPKFISRASAVRLIDFKHCVDMNQFGEDQVFMGCPQIKNDPNSPWLCPILKEGRPWKWQVDYYGLAVSMLALMAGNTGEPHLIQDPHTGQYSCRNFPRWGCTPFLWRVSWAGLANSLPVYDVIGLRIFDS